MEPTIIKRTEYVPIFFFFFLNSMLIMFSGQDDMGVEGWWERLGVSVNDARQYHL